MKKQNILYTIFAFAVLLCGCAKDSFQNLSNDNTPEGMVRLTLDPHAALGADVSTKATDTDVTGNVMALIFDNTDRATAKLKQAPVEVTTTNGKSNILVYEEKTDSYICVVANITEDDKNYLLGLGKDDTLLEISRQLTMEATSAGLSLPIPMSGWSNKVTTIEKNMSTAIAVHLTRAVALINVNGTDANFTIHGVQLSNAAKRGYLLKQPLIPFFGISDVVAYNETPLSPTGMSFTNKIYCFENRCVQGNTIYPTRIVIKGQRTGAITPSYYGVDIIYPETTGSSVNTYHIERNKIYTINLKQVLTDGYATYEEAVKADPFNKNIANDIIVTDPYAYDVITNGQQFIGATNTEFVLYPEAGTKSHTDLHIATISYTCASNWGIGSVWSEPNSGITLLEGVERLEVQQGTTPIYRDIIIKQLDANFKSGSIFIEIGNLIKEIKIRVNNPTLTTGQVSGDYTESPLTALDYKVGQIINPAAETSWLKVSLSNVDDGSSSLNDKIVNPSGGIYIHALPYITQNANVEPREASLFVSGEKSRILVMVRQKGYDLKSSNKQITPHTYVGTFHRWNQTAERVIQMTAAGSTWWSATVVSGGDFIIVSKGKSKDTKLGTKTPDYSTDEQIEANCQVDGRLRSIDELNSGGNIYFRVGLTSKLANQQAAPRYGMIAVTYGNNNGSLGVHNIYVRQGEAADYVMQPSDASYSAEWKSNIRPKAVKLCPYNLTDVLPNGDVTDRNTHGYNFVQYPSQGGYYFLASGTQAIKPTVTSSVTGLNPPAYSAPTKWNKTWETCPKGYRRPADGENGRAYDTAVTAGDIANSEIRQSLWYSPTGGAEKEEINNQLFGYLADGYFDRREIEQLDTPLPNITHGIVNKGDTDAAYCGILTFNPNSYASIFTPFSGRYSSTSGATDKGRSSSLQVTTPGTSDDSGWLISFGNFNGKYALYVSSRTSATDGYSVRCVKDENPPINTDDSQVEKPGTGDDTEVVSMMYANTTQTLQEQIEARYNESKRKNMTTLAINAIAKNITADDYIYLNSWANASGFKLRNIVLRGVGSEVIPTGAFTSPNWSSINLSDAHTLRTGAFAATLTGLRELTLSYLDLMTVEATAFAFTTPPYIYLGPAEFAIKQTDASWKGYTWKYVYKIG